MSHGHLDNASSTGNPYFGLPMELLPLQAEDCFTTAAQTRHAAFINAFDAYERSFRVRGATPSSTLALVPSSSNNKVLLDAVAPLISSSRAAECGLLAVRENKKRGTPDLPPESFWCLDDDGEHEGQLTSQQRKERERQPLPTTIWQWAEWHDYKPPQPPSHASKKPRKSLMASTPYSKPTGNSSSSSSSSSRTMSSASKGRKTAQVRAFSRT